GFDFFHQLLVGTFTTYIVLILATLSGSGSPKIVISDHTDKRTHSRDGWTANLYYSVFKYLVKIFRLKVKSVITFSHSSKATIAERFGLADDLFSVIPLGYDQDSYFPIERVSDFRSGRKFTIGFAGKIDKKKRVDYLINTV